jgi:hypothetical protein
MIVIKGFVVSVIMDIMEMVETVSKKVNKNYTIHVPSKYCCMYYNKSM